MTTVDEIAEIRARLDALEARETLIVLWTQRRRSDWTTVWEVDHIGDSGGIQISTSTFPQYQPADPGDSYGGRSDPDVFIGLVTIWPEKTGWEARYVMPDGGGSLSAFPDRETLLARLQERR